ncbi:sarcosine oxidase subunit gamma [Jannaschia donghaensis]|uniref:Sarcosine oxidase, gamma subunit family n=1 Tax=Jannaschia donghaensis TaxID=420998 RepID=A0A0M6YNS2_9RHOB|nr:sarcosine oxidase subunit gamma family protein [Jannaschia donghaensis]CTQ50656.1 sarcosine oxidase, gamma subunit family [Jannaschia donghaensis]
MSDLSIHALPPVGMITLRGAMPVLTKAVTAVTGCDAPAMRMSTRAGDVTAMWMEPDEMMVVCTYDGANEMAGRLRVEMADDFATVAVVSDARQIFEINGTGGETLLAKLMPVDFAKLGATEVRRTRMAQIPAAVWRNSDGFQVMCFRSVADYATDLLHTVAPVGG